MPTEETPVSQKAAGFLKKLGRYWKSVLSHMENRKIYQSWMSEAGQSQTFYTGRGDMGVFYGANLSEPPEIIQGGAFKYKYNKVFEFVRILTPELYYRNPTLTVNVRNANREDGEYVEEMAKILRDCINYHYDELDFVGPRRDGIINFLLSGRGPMFTFPERLQDDTLVIREKSIAWKDFFIDPDATSIDEVTWMGHKTRMPKTLFIKKYGDEVNRLFSKASNPNELIEYVEVYTQLGLFGGLSDEFLNLEEFQAAQKEWGDYVKITFVPEPYYEHAGDRNDMYNRDTIGPRVIKVEKWEVPFWRDSDPKNRWPYTLINSHVDPDSIFPISPVATSLGEARMVNWFATMLAIRQLNSTRAVVALHPGIDEKQLEKLQNSIDMTFISAPLDVNDRVDKAFSIHSLEPDNGNIIRGLLFWIDQFDTRTGLAEVKYISPTQPRSAEESAQRGRVANRTIDGLFAACEMAFTQLSRKHAYAWRYLATQEDVAMIVGQQRAQLWEEYQKGTMETMVRDYNIQILGDTMRRPDKASKKEQATMVMENLMGIAAQVGDLEAINKIVLAWQEELGIPEWKQISFNPPPPPEPEPEAVPPGGDMMGPTVAPMTEEVEGTTVDLNPGGAV